MKQERHADHLLPRGSATNPVDSDDWREEAKGETPQVVEETPEEFVRHMLSPLSVSPRDKRKNANHRVYSTLGVGITFSFPPTFLKGKLC